MDTRRLAMILLLMAAVVGLRAQPGRKEVESAIRECNEIWNRAFNSRDTSSLYTLFNAETILTTAGGRWIGDKECKRLVRALFKNRPDIEWTNTSDKIEVFDSWKVGYEQGVWTESWSSKDSGRNKITGRYWIMYTSEDDHWTIHSSIFTPLSCEGNYCK